MPASDNAFPHRPITFTPSPPFSWQQTVTALQGFGPVPDRGRRVEGSGSPCGAAGDVQEPGVVSAGSAGPSWELALRVGTDPERLTTVRLEPGAGEGPFVPDFKLHVPDAHDLTLGEAHEIVAQLDDFLALWLEVGPLVEESANDPAFQPVVAALYGYHPPRFRSAFQAACWTVVRQRTPQKFAVTTMERIVALLGDHVPAADGASLPLFPVPARMAHGARPELLAATNNLRKVERLEGLAAEFASVDEAELRTAPYDEAFKWLKGLPGLGPWSAEQVMWRGLGRLEHTPWRDTGALDAISAVYTPGLTLVKSAAREQAKHYGELQGLWLAYLKAYPRVRAAAASPG